MYTNSSGEVVTSLNGQSMRSETVSLDVQQRVQLLDYAQRAHHYHRLQAALLPTTFRVLPPTSSSLQSHPTSPLGCSGLLSFIYSRLHGGGSPIISPSQNHLRFLQVAAAAAAATTPSTHHDEPKPSQSYIGLIAMAILSSKERKLVLSDIYQWILDHYAYFRYRGPGWRNSIRHNLSLNDCFVKAGRSANGKGHYWAIHPANVEDFERGDFRRRRAQRKVRRAMGLSVPDDDDSPGPSLSTASVVGLSTSYCSWTPSKSPPLFFTEHGGGQPLMDDWNRVASTSTADKNPAPSYVTLQPGDRTVYRHDTADSGKTNIAVAHQPRVKRRLFDMDSILAPDDHHQLQTSETPTVLARQLISYTSLHDDNADSQHKLEEGGSETHLYDDDSEVMVTDVKVQ